VADHARDEWAPPGIDTLTPHSARMYDWWIGGKDNFEADRELGTLFAEAIPSIRTDLRNAGGKVVDEEVVVDGNVITSRSPADLPAFCASLVAQLEQAPAHS